MEDNIFDKIFEEKLNTPQHYEFHEAAWLDVEQQLQPASRKRFWWLVAASIAFPILMMGAYFYSELTSATNEIVALKKKMETLQSQQNKIASNDGAQTLEVTESIASEQNSQLSEVTSTTVSSRTINKDQALTNAQNSINTSKNQSAKTSNKRNSIIIDAQLEKSIATELMETKTATSNQYNEFAINNYGVKVDENAIDQVNENIAELNKSTTEQRAVAILSPNSLKGIVRSIPKQRISSNIPLELILASEKISKPNPILFFKPEGYKVGLIANGAPIISQHRGQSSSYGVVGEVLFPENISMGMGLEYSHSNNLQLNWNADLPFQEPLEVGDQLRKIELHTDWIQVPVYLKYVYERVDKSLNPYIRVGAIMRRSVQKQYIFVFENIDDSEQYQREAPPEEGDVQTFAMNTINAGLGVDYNVTKNINLQLEAYVNHDMVNKDITANLDMVGLQTSVTCSF